MTDVISPWLRADRRATGRLADAMLIAFHRGPLRDDVPFELARFGAPGAAAVAVLDVAHHVDAAWIAGWRQGGMRAIASGQLPDLAALDGCDQCHAVRAMIADPTDLTYLQAAWAMARWLVARGAAVVLDVFPIRYWTAAAIAAQDPTAPFDPEREVAILCEVEPAAASATGHVVHTRGLGKLARPDLVAITEPARIREAADVIAELVARLADGYMPTDGEVVELEARRALLVPAPRGSIAEALHLNNDAWLVAPL